MSTTLVNDTSPINLSRAKWNLGYAHSEAEDPESLVVAENRSKMPAQITVGIGNDFHTGDYTQTIGILDNTIRGLCRVRVSRWSDDIRLTIYLVEVLVVQCRL